MEEAELSFAIKRKIVKELKSIEEQIKESDLKGWIGYTELKNDHIMVMYSKLGAKPYSINIKERTAWFKKIL